MPTQTGRLSADLLHAALAGLEAQSRKIDEQIAQVRAMLGTGPKRRGRPPKSESASPEVQPAGRKRRFSAATRAKMREAQQRRWAAVKGTSTEAPAKAPAKAAAKAAPKKRQLSAAGRKRIVEATKQRWAKVKAAKAAEAGE